MKKAVIFDLDGTLWDATENVAKGWNECLNELLPAMANFDGEKIACLCGLTTKEIGEKLFPGADDAYIDEMMEMLSRAEVDYLNGHGGIIYSDLEDTIKELGKDYLIFVVSNCSDGYLDAFLDYHQFRNMIDDYEMYGRTFLKKSDNIRLIMNRNDVTRAVYVGDTAGDENAAREAGIPFIHASYGFGQALSPDYTATSLKEVIKGVKEVLL